MVKRTIFIGQAMPRIKNHPHDWPSLNKWLFSIGLSIDQIKTYFCYSALVDYFPGSVGGSHTVPSPEAITKERNRLRQTLIDFNPKVVVPIGRLSIAYCLNREIEPLAKTIGKIYRENPYQLLDTQLVVIPLPHPSGASTWTFSEQGKKLLPLALEIIKQYVI